MSNNLILLFFTISCLWAKAYGQEFSQNPQWHKLLHYSHHFLRSPGSDVTSQEFFLAKDGATNPEAELKATIDALHSSQEVSCRFPARRLWLEKMGLRFPSMNCPGFDAWTRGHSVKSISLIFATGFLGNPASYFGHPLLKLNFKDDTSPLDLMDTAINYGAFTPPDVGALPYAINGLFGGYEAGFTSADFFFHRNNYSELELRDLWEYELKLSAEQVTFLVAHVWEMQRAKIPYYFFSDNCAYRMSELLELVTEKKLISKNSPVAIPSVLFHNIYDQSLYTEIKLLKSRQTRLREKVFSLSKKERRQLQRISENPDYVSTSRFKSLDERTKSRVLETAMDYYSFRQVSDEDEGLKEAKRKVLRERVALPARENKWKGLPQRPPHEAQRPTLTQVGFFHSEKFGNGESLRLRPVFYDIVSPDTARPPLSSLSVLDVELNATDKRAWIKSLKLISLESLNISKTQLSGDGGYAWRVKAGADQLSLACHTCLVPVLDFGIGKAWEVSKSVVVYAMMDPRLQSVYQDSGYMNVTPSISTLMTYSDDVRFNLVAGRRYYFNTHHTAESMYKFEGRFGSSRTWDVRANFEQHLDRRYGLAMAYYW